MLFDDKVVNAAIFNEGAVFSNVKGKKNYLNNINISDENGVLDFLENANDTFEGIELVLSCFDYKEKEGKKLEELIEKIKKCCEEKLKINVTVCEESQISHNQISLNGRFWGQICKLYKTNLKNFKILSFIKDKIIIFAANFIYKRYESNR